MSVVIDGTSGITTPAETVQGALTTTGNTILGDASTDTLNVGNGGLVKDASGRVGIGTASPDALLTLNAAATAADIRLKVAGALYANIYANSYALTLNSISAIPLSLGTNNTEQASISSTGVFSFNSGYGSAATAYGCRAWVNFNGTGTVAIRASGNVSSITDTGLGNYLVNFTTSMVDANYVMTGTSSTSSGSNPVIVRGPSTPATGSAAMETIQANGTNQDPAGVYLAFFR